MVSIGTRSCARALACILLALAACGCFEYTEEITLYKDGSGTVNITGWIDGKVAADFYTSDEVKKIMPPVTKGIANAMSAGSEKVVITDFVSGLQAGQWRFEVTLEFADLDALNKVKFFNQREFSLTYVTAKQTRFRSYPKPDLLQTARDMAQVHKDNPYSKTFLEAEEVDLRKLVAAAPIVYKVTLPGSKVRGNAETTDHDPREGTVTAVWEYTLDEMISQEKPPRFELTVDLPAIQLFRTAVVVLLLLSLIGILVPAIRLVVLKLQRVS
ncbi:MAG: hypothetical protein ACYTAN_01225 [Planctomycetota bacterium]